MPVYIEETRRGYPDPVDTDTQDIELYGGGKGSYIFGKDEVFYVGDPEEQVVNNTAQRNKIFRWYNGKFVDHLYTNDEDEDLKKYNREPRGRQQYVFTAMRRNVSGSVPLYRHYSTSKSDTKLSLSSSVSGYTSKGIIGYVFTSQAAANNYRNVVINEQAVPVYFYYSSTSEDSFYTLHPENEVNLAEYNSGGLGPPYPPNDRQDPDRGDEYAYNGILCWTFERIAGTDTKTVIEIGKPQYAGSAFTYGWLSDVNGGTALGNVPTNWTIGRYSFFGQRYNINDQRANFTFLYGEFGPVKAALPRFLNYKFLYDSQFFYYLYDTTDPWNGPLFGVRMQTDKNSLGNCCINTAPQGQPSTCPTTDPYIYRYYYQPRANTWKTKRTRIYTDVKAGEGEDQNILTAGTADKIVFFRYTAGSFNMVEGDIVNGWRITEHRYMGDEMSTGFIRISQVTQGADGNDFVYGQVYASSNTTYPSSFIALAGFGIPNKAAVFGVYEFRKVVGYYKIELHPDAAVPKRTMDTAVIEATVDNNGAISGLEIINPGIGYSSEARVEIMPPPNANTSTDVSNARTHYVKSEIADTSTTKDTFNWGSTSPDYKSISGITQTVMKDGVKLKDTSIKIKPATVKVTRLSNEGCIMEVQLLSGGSGYTKQQTPQVIIYDPKKLSFDESPATKSNPELNASSANSTKSMQSIVNNFAAAGIGGDSSKITDPISKAMKTFDEGVKGDVYTGYIKGVADLDPENYMQMCLGVPGTCVQPLFKTMNPLDYYNGKFFANVIKYDQSGGFANGFNYINTKGKAAFDNLQVTADTASGALGGITQSGVTGPTCLKMGQPTLKYCYRFYDIPCSYTEGSGVNQKVYGWMPHQYSASKKESTEFNIYLELDGDFTGTASSTAQNNAFITKLKGLQAPKMLAPRPAASGVKTWQCTRGGYEGRCFRAGDGDISFYPIGLDENVYDYTHLSVTDAYGVWIGQPSNTLTGNAGTGTNGRYYYWLGGGLLTGQKYTGPSQPSTSWDYYVYDSSSNPNGIFKKYTGYDADGNGVGDTARWTNYIYTMPPCEGITDIDSVIAIDPTQIAVNDDLIRIGPIRGKVIVKNWSTGSAKVYADAVNNLGNPYYESCLNATN